MASNLSTTQSLIAEEKMKQNTLMLMQPDANWENYLTPAPLSIAILGELVMISSATDFSLIKNRSEPPNFEYIKYPDSFRACLMQVCNSGWNAFNEAHKSMDRIRLNSAAIPNDIKQSVQILFNTPDKIINKRLPNELKNIKSIADECKTLAENVEKKYLDVIHLIEELLEAMTLAKVIYGKDLEDVQNQIKANKMREEHVKQEKIQAKKAMEDKERELQEAKQMFNETTEQSFGNFILNIFGANKTRIEKSSENLKQVRELHEKSLENMAANEKELNDILVAMQTCNVKEIKFDTTIKMIAKGLKAMGEIKEQWSKMVQFFQMISNIISISLHKTLKDFALTAGEAQELTESERFYLKELLYNQAFEATNVASMVNMISSTYTQVSNRYLMDRISSLSRLMTLDPNTRAFLFEREKLQSSCQEAQSGIRQLALEKKEEYEKMSEERVSKIVEELQAVLPADTSLL